ncbi:MAG TPA: M20/M25/M40 family metallo-hydrolase [Pseudonocardia sp.]|nr:M20/M25/M40 family metallo-hydrolase [Pseudonocardia sp.]
MTATTNGAVTPGLPEGTALLAASWGRFHVFATRLEALTNIDSGSRDVEGLRLMADHVADYAAECGMTVTRVPTRDAEGEPLGEALVARKRGSGGRRVLLAAHLDTVFPAGTAAERPFSVDEHGHARGPGVCDDIGGLLAGITAIEVLDEAGFDDYGEIVLLATPDEEIGSIGSREIIARLGREADVVLALECARATGELVSGRKGVADVRVRLRGRAAHSGIEPGAGASAALGAARVAVEMDRLNDRWPDVTVNVGVLQAGERPNIVASEGELRAEVRAMDTAHFDAAIAALHEISARHCGPGVEATVTVEAPVPPWAPTAATEELLAAAVRVGEEVGVDVRHTLTGGCGDVNLLGAFCPAALDGLGPVGGRDHGPEEYLDLGSVPPRVALLAGLIARVGRDR